MRQAAELEAKRLEKEASENDEAVLKAAANATSFSADLDVCFCLRDLWVCIAVDLEAVSKGPPERHASPCALTQTLGRSIEIGVYRLFEVLPRTTSAWPSLCKSSWIERSLGLESLRACIVLMTCPRQELHTTIAAAEPLSELHRSAATWLLFSLCIIM